MASIECQPVQLRSQSTGKGGRILPRPSLPRGIARRGSGTDVEQLLAECECHRLGLTSDTEHSWLTLLRPQCGDLDLVHALAGPLGPRISSWRRRP
jgi:hypothetical protein